MSSIYSKQEKEYLLEVGNKIRSYRKEKSISQEKFAQVCKLDRTYISDVERGERNISLLTLRKIAKALKVEPNKLIDLK